jgi:cell division GTPase FtsZ
LQLLLLWHPCEDFYVEEPAKTLVEIVDKRLKNMMKELGEAINNSLSDSDEIADVISRIKAGGYDVFVVLEATIGFNQNGEGDEEATSDELEQSSAEFKITTQDLKFLKSLRISVGEER